jgi:hypothetical protein
VPNITVNQTIERVTVEGETEIVVARETAVRVVTVGVQGPPGAPGANARNTFTAENKEAIAITRGEVVASHPSGTGFALASAADNSRNGLGLAADSIAAGIAGDVQLGGVLELEDWTEVVGSPALAAKTTYYLDTVPGKLTASAPSIPGQVVQVIGNSISPTALRLEIEEPVLL